MGTDRKADGADSDEKGRDGDDGTYDAALRSMVLLLRSQFGAGDFIEPLAQILSRWNDEQAALDLITASASPEALHSAIDELAGH